MDILRSFVTRYALTFRKGVWCLVKMYALYIGCVSFQELAYKHAFLQRLRIGTGCVSHRRLKLEQLKLDIIGTVDRTMAHLIDRLDLQTDSV